MSIPTIAVLVGSLRRQSLNRRLATALSTLATGKAEFNFVDIGELPLYNQDHDASMPAASIVFRQRIENAQAVLFVTPEYNRSIPGVLKNAIDVGSRPYGQSVWAGKVAAVCGASPGATGTAMAQQHLRNVLSHLDMRVRGQPEVFLRADADLLGEDGEIHNEGTKKFLSGFMQTFLDEIALHNK